MAGGGGKPGFSYCADHKVHVHDLRAMILVPMGTDNERLTYAGRRRPPPNGRRSPENDRRPPDRNEHNLPARNHSMNPCQRHRIIAWTFQIIAAAILLQTLFFKFTSAEESVSIFTGLWAEP